ncbi:hypothetical protein [Pyrobaculum neutrophilum]|uniref:Uncharacterized protein n=1 Tax=Pyrobaculum neutrophilum (strain DSM 2338 / JCM 9278 / NBRC 100436 / V24Sta) TaxID=444157 RepID=B1Y8U1_PYRNV|nr:hypothetical protein [Pyrobaculum neutrophilum]ACB40170.1 hypothetical protein Tneu_1243 [Pyrobaculum neutrophilum V24Sta]
MWTKLKNFITSLCLILAPYVDACKFGAPPERSGAGEVRRERCTKLSP